MDKVFQEEAKKLAEVESKLDSLASQYEKTTYDLNDEIRDYSGVDYEDQVRIFEPIKKCESASEEAQLYRVRQSSPYFARIDLDVENEDESLICYIGKKGIQDGANIIVIDWRSEIGMCYSAKNQTEFCVRGMKYLLALRRAFKIEDEKLISYKTEYDGETVSLDG